MSRPAIVLAALMLTACSGGDLLSREESRTRLSQHRKAYEWLAADLRTCGLPHLSATGQVMDRCAGKYDKATMQSAMLTLGVREAWVEAGEVRLMTGAETIHGLPRAAPVASWMIHATLADPSRADPLTGAPNHWFYSRSD